MKYQDIKFKTRRTQAIESKEQDNGKIGKEPDVTNPEDLSEYIQTFTYLFNKKKFKKLLEQREWDYEINLTEEVLWDTWTLTILFFFSFIFILDDEEACDTAVTWQVTWCDIIGLEHGGRIWKMMSGHIYITWWPWVRNEVNMRL